MAAKRNRTIFLLLLIAPKQKNFCVTKDRITLRWSSAKPALAFFSGRERVQTRAARSQSRGSSGRSEIAAGPAPVADGVVGDIDGFRVYIQLFGQDTADKGGHPVVVGSRGGAVKA